MSISPKFDEKQILSKLAKDFHELVNNKETLRNSVEEFLNNVIDELTLGIIFDLHRKFKTRTFDLRMDEDDQGEESSNDLIFLQHDLKKTQECLCPNCDRAVAATRFAPHLEACMGMGRSRSRNATRRMASKERENPSYSSGIGSDDEDDSDWNSGSKRGKKKKRNGSKKSKGIQRKLTDRDYRSEDTNHIDGTQSDDVLLAFRQFLSDNSNNNSLSPAESVSSNHSDGFIRRKDKNKIKKIKIARSSPSFSVD